MCTFLTGSLIKPTFILKRYLQTLQQLIHFKKQENLYTSLYRLSESFVIYQEMQTPFPKLSSYSSFRASLKAVFFLDSTAED